MLGDRGTRPLRRHGNVIVGSGGLRAGTEGHSPGSQEHAGESRSPSCSKRLTWGTRIPDLECSPRCEGGSRFRECSPLFPSVKAPRSRDSVADENVTPRSIQVKVKGYSLDTGQVGLPARKPLVPRWFQPSCPSVRAQKTILLLL